MSNRIYEEFLKTGLPKRPDGKSYSPTAFNIYRTICYRYDEKKGYSYPGETQLVIASGVSRQSVHTALKQLKEDGILLQKTKGYRNQRAEFIPLYHLRTVNKSVNLGLHNTESKETTRDNQSANLGIEKSKEGTPNETSKVVPISNLSISTSSKEDLFITSLSFIPATKRFVISEEIKKLLHELEHRGTTLEAIEDEFRHDKWESIHNPKAIVLGRLLDMVARPVRYTSERQPPKCANPDCDPVTRKLPYAIEIPNGNGARTRSCPECNFSSVNKRNGY